MSLKPWFTAGPFDLQKGIGPKDDILISFPSCTLLYEIDIVFKSSDNVITPKYTPQWHTYPYRIAESIQNETEYYLSDYLSHVEFVDKAVLILSLYRRSYIIQSGANILNLTVEFFKNPNRDRSRISNILRILS